MIKLIRSLYDFKGFFTMTLAAILPELVIMRIFMTAGTISVSNSGELLEFLSLCSIDFMAFDTFDTPVFPGKPEFGIVVIEL
jgi:hypothetical protein